MVQGVFRDWICKFPLKVTIHLDKRLTLGFALVLLSALVSATLAEMLFSNALDIVREFSFQVFFQFWWPGLVFGLTMGIFLLYRTSMAWINVAIFTISSTWIWYIFLQLSILPAMLNAGDYPQALLHFANDYPRLVRNTYDFMIPGFIPAFFMVVIALKMTGRKLMDHLFYFVVLIGLMAINYFITYGINFNFRMATPVFCWQLFVGGLMVVITQPKTKEQIRLQNVNRHK